MRQCVICQNSDYLESENTLLDHSSKTCIHCRIYKDPHILGHELHDIPTLTALSNKLKDSVHRLNNPVVLLGIPS